MSSNPAFEQALREVSQLTKKPNNEEMLKLYGKKHNPFSSQPRQRNSDFLTSLLLFLGLYKIATGHDFSKAEQPYRVQLEASLTSLSTAPVESA
jgi:hypothetical protein